MFPAWRLKLREVQVAVDSQRYEEAIALLERESLREFLPAKKLAQVVAGKMVERANQRFARGDSAAGWQDLAIAEHLGGQAEAVGALRKRAASTVLEEVRRCLASGQTAAGLERLAKLQRKGLLGEAGRMLEQIARSLREAQNAGQHGHFAQAAAAIQRAQSLAAKAGDPESTMEVERMLAAQGREVVARQTEAERITTELHARLGDENWSAVLSAAEAMLAIAPHHEAARQARRRAWQAVGMDVTRAPDRGRADRQVSLQWNRAAQLGGWRSTRSGAGSSEVETVNGTESPKRGLLWVDAVGGFLVCLDDQVVLGQPAQGGAIAVPILADLSRRHAVIRREAGAYVIEPLQAVRINGRVLTGPTVLADGDRIQLGDSVRLRFTRPHALSATARLDFESHHKTQPTSDAVLLMADSLVMGPNSHSHVRCPESLQDVVLYRSGEVFQCRSAAPLSVEGEARSGPIDVVAGERVEGESFSFTWEMAS
jgi:FHA domain